MPRYIDANALQKRLQDFSNWCRDGRKQGVDFVLDCPLPDIPTADVQEVKHGKWIPNDTQHTEPFARNYRCSFCCYVPIDISNYCPNCGARMDGDEK